MNNESAEQILTRMGLWPPPKEQFVLQLDAMGRLLLRLALHHYKNDMMPHLTEGHEEFKDLLRQVEEKCAS